MQGELLQIIFPTLLSSEIFKEHNCEHGDLNLQQNTLINSVETILNRYIMGVCVYRC